MEKFIYWASVCEGVKYVLLIIGILVMVGAILFICDWIEEVMDGREAESKKSGLRAFAIGLAMIVSSILMPSKDVLYTMAVMRAREYDMSNEKIENITSGTLDLLDAWIQEKKNELRRGKED